MAHKSLVILCPVYNDWEAAQLLFKAIDRVAEESHLEVSILAVDDGSSESFAAGLDSSAEYKAVADISVLEMGRNLGHQRAIAVGLSYIEESKDRDAVVVMDADGEDDPRYIPALVSEMNKNACAKVIFAQRTERSEGLGFRVCYGIYRGLCRLLTGTQIRVGNFCIIPAGLLPRIVLLSEIWNHFAAGLLRGRIPYAELPTVRARRLHGSPKMSFISLALHGLGAISVRADVLAARSVIAAVALMAVTLLAGGILLCLRLLAGAVLPAWVAAILVASSVIAIQALFASGILVLLILKDRTNYEFLPKRDGRRFIRDIHRVTLPQGGAGKAFAKHAPAFGASW